jgi:hypothetical protein
MRFILPAGAFTNLNFLRVQYQTERNVNLEEHPSFFGLPTALGGIDVVTRSKQVKFLEKMRVVLNANLIKEEDIKTPEQWTANLTASRVMIAACLYVQSQISKPKKHSVLYRFINHNLGVTEINYLDSEDKEICMLAANRVINSSLCALDQANAALKRARMTPFTEIEWQEFSSYLSEISINNISANPYTNYPITSITQPLFGKVFSYAGSTIGFLGGDVASQSTQLMSTKMQLTALIGSSLLMLGPTGPMGVALFSQVIAGKLITSFCTISLANILGTVLGMVGQGVGMGVGLPLDAAYRLLWKACSLIGGYYGNHPNNSKLTGIRIGDGVTMIGGIAIEVTPIEDLPKGFEQKSIEIKNDGKIYIDGKLVEIPETGVQLPAEVIAELKMHLPQPVELTKELQTETSPQHTL